MHRRIISTVGLAALALALPNRASGQAEEAPVADEVPAAPPAPSPTAASSSVATEPAPDAPAAQKSAPVPPAAVPPKPATSPAEVERPSRLLFLPYIGMNVPVGLLAERYSPGVRFGAIGGWHLSPKVSLNGEVGLDLIDASDDESFLRPHEYYLDFTLSPLLHLRSGSIVVGPKLGWFVNRRWQSLNPEQIVPIGPNTARRTYVPNLLAHTGQGLTVGLNLAAFADVGGVALGMIATVGYRKFVSSRCDDYDCGNLIDPIVLDLSVAALF